jgi:hypothetical protein
MHHRQNTFEPSEIMCVGYVRAKTIKMFYFQTEQNRSSELMELDASFSILRQELIPEQSMWDLWCTKWHWDRSFPGTPVYTCQ